MSFKIVNAKVLFSTFVRVNIDMQMIYIGTLRTLMSKEMGLTVPLAAIMKRLGILIQE
jgi:hypothetical protein